MAQDDKGWLAEMGLKKRLIYSIFFVLVLFAICWFLVNPWIGKMFYPYPESYREYIEEYGEKYQVDPLFIAAVIQTESSFNSEAVSPKGACGLMQLMPSTAEWAAGMIGFEQYSPDDLFEPRLNIQIGSWYLSSLQQQFSGNKVVVLAAYNGGRTEAARWLEQNIWDGRESTLEQIPYSETRQFIQRAITAYRRYQEI
ncbi:MAG TPA: transglycosylase SLT domain-containing protein, partial [Firmicutes bacterium]|nr:transglycosylase SLT domain-containing protein [Bacillota bacterium]